MLTITLLFIAGLAVGFLLSRVILSNHSPVTESDNRYDMEMCSTYLDNEDDDEPLSEDDWEFNDDHVEGTGLIKDMPFGVKGYTTPWAAGTDGKGNWYVNGRYTVHSEPGGTVRMPIMKVTNGEVMIMPPADWEYRLSEVPSMFYDVRAYIKTFDLD